MFIYLTCGHALLTDAASYAKSHPSGLWYCIEGDHGWFPEREPFPLRKFHGKREKVSHEPQVALVHR